MGTAAWGPGLLQGAPAVLRWDNTFPESSFHWQHGACTTFSMCEAETWVQKALKGSFEFRGLSQARPLRLLNGCWALGAPGPALYMYICICAHIVSLIKAKQTNETAQPHSLP